MLTVNSPSSKLGMYVGGRKCVLVHSICNVNKEKPTPSGQVQAMLQSKATPLCTPFCTLTLLSFILFLNSLIWSASTYTFHSFPHGRQDPVILSTVWLLCVWEALVLWDVTHAYLALGIARGPHNLEKCKLLQDHDPKMWELYNRAHVLHLFWKCYGVVQLNRRDLW